MERVERVPVHQSPDAKRIEDRRLTNRRMTIASVDFEFEPGPPRQSHLGRQSKPAVGLKCLHTPTVHRGADRRNLFVLPSPAHPDSATQQIQDTPKSPQPVRVVPSGPSTDSTDRAE